MWYETIEGEAKAGEDFVYAKAKLFFAANEMEKRFAIKIVDDDIEEEDETFTVRLFDLQCHDPLVKLSPMHETANILIVDDDRPGVVSMASQSIEAQEGHGPAKMVLVRQGGGKGVVKVDYSTKDGTAIAGKDYIKESGTVIFKDGELEKEIMIEILDDEM